MIKTNNSRLSSGEMLEYRKQQLEEYLEEIRKQHVPGKTWDVWRDIMDAHILIEEIKIEISREKIKSLKGSLETYKNK